MTMWTITIMLMLLWFLGLLSGVGGSLVYVLLIAALVLLLINLITGRRAF